jgi:hypothetical protein
MFSSASIKKGKKTSIGSYAQEQERVMGEGQEEWQNEKINVDMPRAHAIHIVENAYGGSVKAAIEGRIAAAGVKRKVRDNAVTHLTVYANMPDYTTRSEDEREQFVRLLKKFLEKKYGENNVVDMRWHFDESTPHLHATVVPITADGRLCAKELFAPTKKSMEKWQKEYYAQVAQPLHYSTPDFGHSSEKGYTKETKATRAQLECLQGKKTAAEQEVACLEAQIGQVRARNQELGERARDLEGEVAGLREHVSGLEAAIGAVSEALAGVPAALDMAAHTVAEGFKRAMKAVQAGLLAQFSELFAQALEPEPEPEPEPEHEWTLDDMIENYSEDDFYGDAGSIRSTDDHDL